MWKYLQIRDIYNFIQNMILMTKISDQKLHAQVNLNVRVDRLYNIWIHCMIVSMISV